MWDVQDMRCIGCGIWDVLDVGYSEYLTFGVWNVKNHGCLGCEMWDVQDLGCL